MRGEKRRHPWGRLLIGVGLIAVLLLIAKIQGQVYFPSIYQAPVDYSSRLSTVRILNRVCSAVIIAPDFNSFS